LHGATTRELKFKAGIRCFGDATSAAEGARIEDTNLETNEGPGWCGITDTGVEVRIDITSTDTA
jgi:hypothetical protein